MRTGPGVSDGQYLPINWICHDDLLKSMRTALISSEPAVTQAFTELWGTEELIVSFDAVNVTFPYGEHGRKDIEWVNPWPYVFAPSDHIRPL